jgi:hypothetical protein
MNGHEKSDYVTVAAKPANKVAHPAVEQSATALAAAELVEPVICYFTASLAMPSSSRSTSASAAFEASEPCSGGDR